MGMYIKMPRITKKHQRELDFVEELKTNILEKLPNMEGWIFHQEIIQEWKEESGMEWRIRSTMFSHPEHSISCDNYRSINKLKLTKAEKRKLYISKQCFIFFEKDFPDKVPKIIDGGYTFTYMRTKPI